MALPLLERTSSDSASSLPSLDPPFASLTIVPAPAAFSHDIDSFFAMGGALTPRAADAGSPMQDHLATSDESGSSAHTPTTTATTGVSSLSFALSHRGVQKDFDALVKMGIPRKPKESPSTKTVEDIDSLLRLSEANASTTTLTSLGGLRTSSSSVELRQEVLVDSGAPTRSHMTGVLLSLRSGQDIDAVLVPLKSDAAAPAAVPNARTLSQIGRFSSFPPRSYSSSAGRQQPGETDPEANLLGGSKGRFRYSAPNIFAMLFGDGN